jgi:hypothetical protein
MINKNNIREEILMVFERGVGMRGSFSGFRLIQRRKSSDEKNDRRAESRIAVEEPKTDSKLLKEFQVDWEKSSANSKKNIEEFY